MVGCSIVDVSGFSLFPAVNGRYIRDSEQTQHGEPTFTKADGSMYIYYCRSASSGLYYVSPTSLFEKNERACAGVAKGSDGTDFWLPTTAGWQELNGITLLFEPQPSAQFLCKSASSKCVFFCSEGWLQTQRILWCLLCRCGNFRHTVRVLVYNSCSTQLNILWTPVSHPNPSYTCPCVCAMLLQVVLLSTPQGSL